MEDFDNLRATVHESPLQFEDSPEIQHRLRAGMNPNELTNYSWLLSQNFGEQPQFFALTLQELQSRGIRLNSGDIVHYTVAGDYRNEGKIIFNGNTLQLLAEDFDEYGCI